MTQEKLEPKEDGFHVSDEGPYYVDTHCVRCGKTRMEHENLDPEACGFYI